MSKSDWAQLIAGILLAFLTAVLAIVARKDTVAVADTEYELEDGTKRKVTRGTVIPEDEAVRLPRTAVKTQRRSALGAILVGKDHRTSTSKTIAFAWTLAVAFGLLSLVVALVLGDDDPWDTQIKRGLQEEYLLLLGGPYAAAILAKYAAVQNETSTDAPVGEANAQQLVNDDGGDADLGDFQYVLFSVIGLTFFFGDFVGDLAGGFPELPALLTGLILTSTGGYAAKKLIAQTAPTLTSVLPSAAQPDAEIQVFGSNLAVPASASGSNHQMNASVLVGSQTAVVTAHDLVLGNERLTVKVPADAEPGPAPISAVRADGVPARGPSGMSGLPFEVLPPAAPPPLPSAPAAPAPPAPAAP